MLTLDKCEKGFKLVLENSKTCEVMDLSSMRKYIFKDTIIYTKNDIKDCSSYNVQVGDIILQKDDLVLKVLDINLVNSLECRVIDLRTKEEVNVPFYLLRKGVLTDNLLKYFSTLEPTYLVNAEIPLNDGRLAKVVNSFIKDLAVIVDKDEYLVCKDDLLYEGGFYYYLTNDVIGRTVLQKNSGVYATCIKLIEYERIWVRFEDGVEKEVARSLFKKGLCSPKLAVLNPKPDQSLVGKICTNKYGMKARVIQFNSVNCVICMYEDGYVVKVGYQSLICGEFLKRDIYSTEKSRRLGLGKKGSVIYDSVCNKYILRFTNGCTEVMGYRPKLHDYIITRKGKLLSYYYDRRGEKYVIVYEKSGMRYIDTQKVRFN